MSRSQPVVRLIYELGCTLGSPDLGAWPGVTFAGRSATAAGNGRSLLTRGS